MEFKDWVLALLITQGPMSTEELADELDRLGVPYSSMTSLWAMDSIRNLRPRKNALWEHI